MGEPKPAARGLRSAIGQLVIIIGMVLLTKTVAAEAYYVPSGSMQPTLLIGDELIVSKFSYGYSRFSLPLAVGPAHAERLFGRMPKRGDVVVFRLPRDPSQSYVKRVVGLPGDRLSVDGGLLSINGKVVQQQPSGDFVWEGRKLQRLREQMPNGAFHEILRIDKAGPLNTAGPYVVPEGSYFVMGDNRDNSLDSRSWTDGKGRFIPSANIIGRVNYVYWSGFERLGRMGTALK